MKMDNKKKINLIAVIIIGIIGLIITALVKMYNPENESFFMPCIVYTTTGIKCPGCGITRAIHYLLNGNIGLAIWYNLMLIPLILVGLFVIYRYMRYLLKNEKIIDNKLLLVLKITAIMLLVFCIVRNLTTAIY